MRLLTGGPVQYMKVSMKQQQTVKKLPWGFNLATHTQSGPFNPWLCAADEVSAPQSQFLGVYELFLHHLKRNGTPYSCLATPPLAVHSVYWHFCCWYPLNQLMHHDYWISEICCLHSVSLPFSLLFSPTSRRSSKYLLFFFQADELPLNLTNSCESLSGIPLHLSQTSLVKLAASPFQCSKLLNHPCTAQWGLTNLHFFL